MNYYGLILGICMFAGIGFGHVMVIKFEYYFGTKLWPFFLIIGLLCISMSISVSNKLISGIFGIFGFIFLFSIYEIFKQQERVKKGWFPKNLER